MKRRVGWLPLLFLVNAVTGSIIAGQEALLVEIVILAAFIPLLIGTGGNVGAQSATVVIRGLATGEVHPKRALGIMIREVGIGAVLGLVLGIAVLGLCPRSGPAGSCRGEHNLGGYLNNGDAGWRGLAVYPSSF